VLQVAAQVIGNDTAITIGGMQGQFELNVRVPLIARNLLQSIGLLAATSVLLAEKCVDGIEPNRAGLERSAESTLAVATALNPYIGYDRATEIVKEATRSGRTLREVAREAGVDERTLDEALDLRQIARGSAAAKPGAAGGAAKAGAGRGAAKAGAGARGNAKRARSR
jgi:fumarate hydratase class II